MSENDSIFGIDQDFDGDVDDYDDYITWTYVEEERRLFDEDQKKREEERKNSGYNNPPSNKEILYLAIFTVICFLILVLLYHFG